MQKHYPGIVAYLLMFLFIYTATSKLMNIASFSSILHAMPLISSLSAEIAYLIPMAEIMAAALLFFPSTQLYGFIISLILLFGFTAFLVYALIISDHLPCSCGGIISSMSWTQHIFFNSFMILLSSMALYQVHKQNRNLLKINTTSLLQ